jgi:HSP20 family molecular chaperone IbpA
MALARRTPTSGLTPWPPGRQLQRRFEEMFGRSEGDEGGWLAGAWAPPVDLYEAADAWMLKAELPGLSKDAIHIEGHERTLTRRGEAVRLMQERQIRHLASAVGRHRTWPLISRLGDPDFQLAAAQRWYPAGLPAWQRRLPRHAFVIPQHGP